MASQTETEAYISQIIKSNVQDLVEDQEKEFSKLKDISIQTIIKDNKSKIMVVKVPKSLLPIAQRKYDVIVKNIKQKFPDYYIIMVENIDLEGKVEWENKKKVFHGACYPYLINGMRTDFLSVDEHTTHIFLEKRCAFTKEEFETIEAAINGLLNINVTVGINHHTRN